MYTLKCEVCLLAGFRKHIEVASIGSAVLATSILAASIVSPKEAMILWLGGTLGGILPDVDSDKSTSLNLVFGLLSFLLLCLVLSQFSARLSTLGIWVMMIVTYVILNRIVRPVFEYFTVHRGVFHSLLSAVFFLFGITAAAHIVLGLSHFMSWMLGSFVFLGFIIHLILDELYSVDLSNVRIKRSFGSALKLFEYKDLKSSALMLLAALGLFYLTPPIESFAHVASSLETYQRIKNNFLPSYF